MYPNLAYQPNAVPFRKQQLSSTVGGKEGVGYMYGAGVWVGRENDNGSQAPTCLHWLSPCPNPGQWTFRHHSRFAGRTLRVRLACERERARAGTRPSVPSDQPPPSLVARERARAGTRPSEQPSDQPPLPCRTVPSKTARLNKRENVGGRETTPIERQNETAWF